MTKLLIATGGKPKALNNAGSNLNNILTLRSADDQARIKQAAQDAKDIVVIGGGFTGNEVVSSLQKAFKGKKNISMICDQNMPMDNYVGYEVGNAFLNEHQKNGAKVYSGKQISGLRFEGKDVVKKVIFDSGYEINADLVVMCYGGIELNTGLAQSAGLEMDGEGAIKTNPFMQTSDPHIFAAGDIASFPSWHVGKHIRTEHWITAQDQGTYAAFNMLGKMQPYGEVPYYWTNNYGKGMAFVGHVNSWDDIHIDGNPRDNKFIAYYIKQNEIIGACGQGRGKDILTVFEALSQNVMPTADLIKSGAETAESIQKKLKLNKGGGCRRENCCQKKSVAF